MFLGYIHTFRALAIFFIVAGHCLDAFAWNDAKDIERILRISFSNGTILFVFIAGYLFQHLAVRFSYSKYLKAKLNNVIIPYIFISIPAILGYVFFLKREVVWDGFYNAPAWIQIVNFYLTGLHLSPFWFIPFITVFYLLSPLLVFFDKNKYFYYFIPVFIWVTCITDRGFANPIASFVHLFSVYVLGMCFSHHKDFLNKWLGSATLIFTVLVIVIVLFGYEFYFVDKYYSYINNLQKMVFCVFVLGSLIRLGEKATHHYLNLTADFSFGIFFVHSYVISVFKIIYKALNGYLPAGGVGVYLMLVFMVLPLSMTLVFFIKKASGYKSKFFIGS